jgi:hypothetical protein
MIGIGSKLGLYSLQRQQSEEDDQPLPDTALVLHFPALCHISGRGSALPLNPVV